MQVHAKTSASGDALWAEDVGLGYLVKLNNCMYSSVLHMTELM